MQFKQQIESWLEKLRAGSLGEDDLTRALDQLGNGDRPTQRILYLQARTTAVDGEVIGMAEVVNGEILDPPDNPEDWPYATVSDAIRDGWRVVKFPELALLLDEDKTYGLGCEFILEK